MADGWDHNGWRRETSVEARREELILHIEEVESRLEGFSFQGGIAGQQARRYELDAYLKRLESHLEKINQQLGLDRYSDHHHFVSTRPGR